MIVILVKNKGRFSIYTTTIVTVIPQKTVSFVIHDWSNINQPRLVGKIDFISASNSYLFVVVTNSSSLFGSPKCVIVVPSWHHHWYHRGCLIWCAEAHTRYQFTNRRKWNTMSTIRDALHGYPEHIRQRVGRISDSCTSGNRDHSPSRLETSVQEFSVSQLLRWYLRNRRGQKFIKIELFSYFLSNHNQILSYTGELTKKN